MRGTLRTSIHFNQDYFAGEKKKPPEKHLNKKDAVLEKYNYSIVIYIEIVPVRCSSVLVFVLIKLRGDCSVTTVFFSLLC